MGPPLSSQYILKVSVSSCSAYKQIVLFSVNNWVKPRASGLRLKELNFKFAWILERHEIFFENGKGGRNGKSWEEDEIILKKNSRYSNTSFWHTPFFQLTFFDSFCMCFSSLFVFLIFLLLPLFSSIFKKKNFFLSYYVQYFHFLLQKCLGNKLDTPRSTIASLINESWRTEKYS